MATSQVKAVIGSMDMVMKKLHPVFDKFPTSFTGLNGQYKELTRVAADLLVELTAVQAYLPDEPARRKRTSR